MTFRKADLQVPGTYILLMSTAKELTVNIGALGGSSLGKGCYAYVGSAFGPGGLYARLRHHLHARTRPRWHIDYLRKQVEISEIWFTDSRDRFECQWAALLNRLPQSSMPVPGFGASDCHCDSHLFYFPGTPSINIFSQFGIHRMMKNNFTVFKEVP